MKRTVRTAPALALVAALAGCATTTAGSGTPAAGATAGGGAGTTLPIPSDGGGPAPAPTPTGTPAPTGAGGPVRLGRVTVPVPAGSTATVEGDLLCVTLRGATGCSLEVLDVGRVRAAGGSVSTPAPGEPTGWWWGSDVPSCGDGAGAVTRSTVVEKGFRPIGPKNAAYGSWQVSCPDPGQDFAPRLWWLPTSEVAFRQRATGGGAAAAVDRILAGVTFGE